MSKNKKYIFLTTILLIFYFLLTGGIYDQYTKTYPAEPDIESFDLVPSSPVLYQNIEFKAEVIPRSFLEKDDGCSKKERTEAPDELTTSIKITKEDYVIADDKFTLLRSTYKNSGIFTYNTSFSTPGVYTVTATFSSVNYGEKMSSTQTEQFTVSDGGEVPLNTGTYNLTRIYAQCSASATPFEKTSGLGGNYLTIDSNNQVSLKINIALDNTVTSQHPCLESDYSFDISGKMLIFKEGTDSYMKIEYNDDIYAIFNFDYDGSNIRLSYTDNGNEYQFSFQK